MLKTFTLIFLFAVTIAATQGSVAWAQQAQGEPATTAVPVQQVVVLAPTNSRISFVGIHVGEEPKPRLGGFKQFQGYAVVDPASGSINSLLIDINVDSVWTQYEKLTGHLKNADFFDTAKFPAARFTSTNIQAGEKGQCQIIGDLTLHGQTKSISFPAQYRLDQSGLLLTSKFQLDRSQFGMDQMLGGVDKLVAMEIYIGQKTTVAEQLPAPGGGN